MEEERKVEENMKKQHHEREEQLQVEDYILELKKEKVEEASKLLYECQLIKRPITYSDITK